MIALMVVGFAFGRAGNLFTFEFPFSFLLREREPIVSSN